MRKLPRFINTLERIYGQKTFEVRHEKTDLKVLVVVIPKVGWARMAVPILFFGMTPTFREYDL